jgi:flagellar hook-length control protein FliK
MDAGQITMMPSMPASGLAAAAPADVAAAVPADAAAGGMFGTLLAQTMLGIQLSEAQTIQAAVGSGSVEGLVEEDGSLDINTDKNVPLDVVAAGITADQLALLQVQLAALQILPPVQQPAPESGTTDVSSEQATEITAIPEGLAAAGLMQQSAITADTAAAVVIGDLKQGEAKPAQQIQPATQEAKPVAQEAKPVSQDTKVFEASLAVVVPESGVFGKNEAIAGSPKTVTSASMNMQQKEAPADQLRNIQDVELRTQVTTPQVKVASPDQAELQRSAEVQTLPQELSAATRTTSAAAQNPVRFAQSTEVMAAATDSNAQDDFSSDQEQQGAQLTPKLIKAAPAVVEAVLPELLSEPIVASRPVDHNLVNPQTGNQVVVENAGETPEPLRTVVPEQVGRQVADRLVNHEIKQGNDQISFKLSPENLGNLQLNLRMEDQRLKLEIVAENREVRNALLQQADELRETLAKQNIRMDSFEVTTSSNGNLPQQSRDWQQATSEQRQFQPQYATRAPNAGAGFETPVRYFAKQYQSTIDVRF